LLIFFLLFARKAYPDRYQFASAVWLSAGQAIVGQGVEKLAFLAD
jgi:hypothetical protein